MELEQNDLDDAIRNADIRYEIKWQAVHAKRHAYLVSMKAFEDIWEELKGFWDPVVFADKIEYRLRDA